MAAPLPEVLIPATAPGAPPAAAAWWGRGRVRTLEIVLPAAFLILLFGACFLWPLVYPVPKPIGGSVLEASLPPLSRGHIFGTDPVGNDVLSRVLYGGRVSLEIGLAVNVIGIAIGGLLGSVAAYRGRIVDAVIMRVLDVLIAFPGIVLALAIAEGLGPSELHTIWALSFFSVPAFGRIARAATLRLREQTFMLAASLSGTRGWRMLLRHVAPNIVPQLTTFGLLGVGVTIILAGALSFLGLGVPLPTPDWGNMIAQGQVSLTSNPYLVVIPGIFLFAATAAFNLLGDGLRARWSAR